MTGPSAPVLTSLEDLAGQEIQVRRSAAIGRTVQALSGQPGAKGLKEITLIPADENLEDEDLLEMVNAELLPFAIVDSYKARLWAKIFPNLRVREELAVSTGGDRLGRKNSPGLLAEINDCSKRYGEGSSFHAEVMRKYYRSTAIVKNAYSRENQAQFLRVVDIFRKTLSWVKVDFILM